MSGRLFYLIGASGSGKDSLMHYARQRLAGSDILFAHRYITRSSEAGGENYISVSENEFLHRRNAGLFALYWHSHGYHYAIGSEIDLWLKQGFSVVVNGSRAYLAQAVERYPGLLAIWIQVSEETLKQRLQQRGRETETQIEARLVRARQYQPAELNSLLVVDNNRTMEQAGGALVALLQKSLA